MLLICATLAWHAGAGGAQIRNLEGKSGAQIDRVDSLNFKITGTADAVAKCKAMVDLVLSGEADDIFLKPGEIKKDDFSVPRAAVGTIIGQKGAKIRELEETTGANIRVDRGAQSDPTQVKIFGKPACVAAAVTAIEAIVKEVNATVSSKAQTAEQLAAMQQLTGEEFNADVFTENSSKRPVVLRTLSSEPSACDVVTLRGRMLWLVPQRNKNQTAPCYTAVNTVMRTALIQLKR